MPNWKPISLGEVVEFHDSRRIPLSSREREKRQGKFPYYGAQGIIDYIDDYIFDGEFVLVAEDGENLNSRKQPIANLANGQFWVNNHAHIIKEIPGISDDRFILYFLNNSNIAGYVTGAAQPKLSQANLKRFEIKLPPIQVQRQIVKVLRCYDDLIENNQRRIRILEEMAQNLYREWFVHFRYPGHENVPLTDSPLGPIPEGWEIRELGELVDVPRRSVMPSELDPETPYVGLEHMPRKQMILNDWGSVSGVTSTKLSFYKNEILFGKIRPYFHKVVIAPQEGVASSDAIIISVKDEKYLWVVFLTVFSEAFVNHATQTSNGTKMPRANWNVLKKYPVPIPPEENIQTFNKTVSPSFDLANLLMSRNKILGQMRDLLLPKLISGQIEISDAIMPKEDAA